MAVSPGAEDVVPLVADRCPTFSWGLVSDARAYELVVFDLAAQEMGGVASDAASPVIRQKIQTAGLAWTPSLDRCLEPGRRYGWAVRAITDAGPGQWSASRVFEVAADASNAELESAVERVLERYLAARAVSQAVADTTGGDPATGSIAAATDRQPVEGLAVPSGGVAALRGELTATTGLTYGVEGLTHSSTAGAAGVVGESTTSTAGAMTIGVLGRAADDDAVAGVFENTGGGDLLAGFNASGEVFTVAGDGTVEATGFTGPIVDVTSQVTNSGGSSVTVADDLVVAGAATADGLTVTGAATANSLTVTGTATADSLAVAGAATAASLTVTDAVSAGDLTLTGEFSANSLAVTQDVKARRFVDQANSARFLDPAGTSQVASIDVRGQLSRAGASPLVVADNLQVAGGATADTLAVVGDATAQRFVDQANGSRFLDPAGTSQLGSIDVQGQIQRTGASPVVVADDLQVTGGLQFVGDLTAGRFVDQADSNRFVDPAGTSQLQSIDVRSQILNDNGTTVTIADNLLVVGDATGQRFVDQTNSARYLDPAGISQLETVDVRTEIVNGGGTTVTVDDDLQVTGDVDATTFTGSFTGDGAGLTDIGSSLTPTVVASSCGNFFPVTVCPAGANDGPSCSGLSVGAFCEFDPASTCTVLDDNLDNCGTHDWYIREN